MRYCSLAVIAVLLTLPAGAQFTERIDVRVHELEVVVETPDGTPVTGLTREDFIVLQDRIEQPITNFSFINESSPASVKTSEPATVKGVIAGRKPRKFVFFIDQFKLYHATREEFLREFSDIVGNLEGGDEAMVVTPSLPKRVPLFFTSDKHLLMRTLDEATAEIMRRGEAIEYGAPPGRCGPSRRKCVEDRLDQLAWVCRALADVPGRKVVVVMTTMMTSMPEFELRTPAETASLIDPRDMSGRVGIVKDHYNHRGLVAHVAHVAAASNVTIYGLESYEAGYAAMPSQLVETGRDVRVDPGQSPLRLGSAAGGGREAGGVDLLLTLAAMTGAKAFTSTREAPDLFDQISQDLDSYYSIAYRDNEKKPREHLVEVRVRNREDLIVRTRGTVLTRTREEEDRGLAMAAAISSKTYNALHIRLTASPIERHRGRVDVPIRVHIPMSRLAFLDDGGKRRAQFKVLVATIDDQGTYGEAASEDVQHIVVDKSKWDEVQSNEYVYDTVVRVSPAQYRIGVGVMDAASGEAGFQTVLVNAK